MTDSPQYKKLCEGIQYKAFPFEHTINSIFKIIPLVSPYYIIVDASFHLHIAINSALSNSSKIKFPVPSYAKTQNKKVYFSIDPSSLYERAFGKKMSFKVEREVNDYAYLDGEDESTLSIKALRVNPHTIVVQLSKDVPICLIDFTCPENIQVYREIIKFDNISEGPDNSLFLFRYDEKKPSSTCAVHFNLKTRKSRKLNFEFAKLTDPDSNSFKMLKENVVVFDSENSIQFLNFTTNKVIHKIPKKYHFRFHADYEHSFIVYMINMKSDLYHMLQFKNGALFDENQLIFDNEIHGGLQILNDNCLISMNRLNSVMRFYNLTNWNLTHDKDAQYPGGHLHSTEYYCCDRVNRKDKEREMFISGKDCFYLVTKYCASTKYHGVQKVHYCTVSRSSSKKSVKKVNSVEVFSENRDPVACTTIAHDQRTAYFITERGRFYKFDLITYKIQFITVLVPLLDSIVQSKNFVGTIDKLYQYPNPNEFFIGIEDHGFSNFKGYYFNLESFKIKTINDFFQQGMRSVTQLADKRLVAITSRSMAMQNHQDFFKLQYLIQDGETEPINHVHLGDKCPEKIIKVFDDLIIITDEQNMCLYIYNDKFELKATEDLEIAFPDYDYEAKIHDIKPVSKTYYVVYVKNDYMGESCIFSRNGPIRKVVDQNDGLSFIFRLGNSMIFNHHDYLPQTFYVKASELLKPSSKLNKQITEGEDKMKEEQKQNGPGNQVNEENKNEDDDDDDSQDDEDDHSISMIDTNFIQEINDVFSVDPISLSAIDPFKMYLGTERINHHNAICIFRSYNARIEALRVLKKALRGSYHTYTLKMVFESLWLERHDEKIQEEGQNIERKITMKKKDTSSDFDDYSGSDSMPSGLLFPYPERYERDDDSEDDDEMDDDEDDEMNEGMEKRKTLSRSY